MNFIDFEICKTAAEVGFMNIYIFTPYNAFLGVTHLRLSAHMPSHLILKLKLFNIFYVSITCRLPGCSKAFHQRRKEQAKAIADPRYNYD